MTLGNRSGVALSRNFGLNVLGFFVVLPGLVLSIANGNWPWTVFLALGAALFLMGTVRQWKGKTDNMLSSPRGALAYLAALTVTPAAAAIWLFSRSSEATEPEAGRMQGLAIAALLAALLFGAGMAAVGVLLWRQRANSRAERDSAETKP